MDFSIPDSALSTIQPDTGKPQRKAYEPDPRIFKVKLERENNYNYKAKLRLLYKPGSPQALVKVFRHYFSDPVPGSLDANGKGKVWTTSALCPKTIGEKCPICDESYKYSDLFKQTNDKRFEEMSRKRRPTVSYLTNVYIINDTTNEKNNGEVKAWFMTNGVYKKVQELMYPKKPEIDDEEFSSKEAQEPIIPFHPTEGVNMMLIANHDDKGWQSYENTQFSNKITPIASDKEAIDAILSKCHDLEEWTGKDKVMSYDDLVEKLRNHNEKTNQYAEDGAHSVVEGASDGPGLDVPESHKRVNVVEGDSEEFFGGSIDDDEFSMPDSAPARSSSETETSSGDLGDEDDDDLPF